MKKKHVIIKTAAATLLAISLALGGTTLTSCLDKRQARALPTETTENGVAVDIIESDQQTKVPFSYENYQSELAKHCKTVSWADGKKYIVCDQEFLHDLAGVALQNLQTKLNGVGAKTIGSKTENFYPTWFDEDFLCSVMFTESSNRVANEDGSVLETTFKHRDGSVSHYFGPTQINASAIESLNQWYGNIGMEKVKNEDLNDPLKAMEITAGIFSYICKFFANMTTTSPQFKANTNIFNYGIEMTEQNQFVAATGGYEGVGTLLSAAKNGTFFDVFVNDKDEHGYAEYVRRITKNIEKVKTETAFEK